MTEFVLVRHGQTVWHADNRYAGRSEVDLTDLGRDQAKVLGGWAAGADLRAVVASPMRRAIETATPAATATGLDLVADPRLIEVDFGRGEGMTRTEMRGVFPDEVAAFVRAPASHPLPGGEVGAVAVARAMPALTDLAPGGGRVLVVAHKSLIRLLLCALIGVSLDRYRTVFPRLDNATLTVIGLDPDGPASLRALNVPL